MNKENTMQEQEAMKMARQFAGLSAEQRRDTLMFMAGLAAAQQGGMTAAQGKSA